MTVRATSLQSLNADAVPAEHRSWVERVLVVPINRALDVFRALLANGITLQTHVNAQVIDLAFTPPSSSADPFEQLDWSGSRFDTALTTVAGPVVGLQVLGAWTLDSAGHDAAPVSGLCGPSWKEVVVQGRKHLRLVYQPGLTSGTRYRLRLLAWGGVI